MELIKEYWGIVTGIGTAAYFIISQIITYAKLKDIIAELKSDINGVGSKVRENHKESEKFQKELLAKVSHLEGFLQGYYRTSKSKNGNV